MLHKKDKIVLVDGKNYHVNISYQDACPVTEFAYRGFVAEHPKIRTSGRSEALVANILLTQLNEVVAIEKASCHRILVRDVMTALLITIVALAIFAMVPVGAGPFHLIIIGLLAIDIIALSVLCCMG